MKLPRKSGFRHFFDSLRPPPIRAAAFAVPMADGRELPRQKTGGIEIRLRKVDIQM